MKIHIKNMVCERCNLAVSTILQKMRLKPVSINLGLVDFGAFNLSSEQLNQLKNELYDIGFEILDDKKSQVIDKIKTSIIELVHQKEDLPKIILSDYLKNHVNYDYNHISQLFSGMEGITIEQFFISQKVERIKELLTYNQLSSSEISYKLGYSSPAHLSGQFKKNTGMTPSQFKKTHAMSLRKPLDEL